MRSKHVLFCVFAWLFLASCAAWAATPAERGPYGVGEFHDDAVDAARGREIDLLILYPLATGAATDDAGGRVPPHPVQPRVHALGRSVSVLRGTARIPRLRRRPAHLRDVDGRHQSRHPRGRRPLRHRPLPRRSQRTQAVRSSGSSTSDAIGAAGHSFGGKLALLEAATDSRIRAIATLDPVDGSGPVLNNPVLYPSVTPELMPEIHAPLLFVGAELGGLSDRLIPCAPTADNYQRFYEAANSPAVEITQTRSRTRTVRGSGRRPHPGGVRPGHRFGRLGPRVLGCLSDGLLPRPPRRRCGRTHVARRTPCRRRGAEADRRAPEVDLAAGVAGAVTRGVSRRSRRRRRWLPSTPRSRGIRAREASTPSSRAACRPHRATASRRVASWVNPSLRGTAALATLSGRQWISTRSTLAISNATLTSADAASVARPRPTCDARIQ